MKDFEEWEDGHPLDITELVDIEIKCNGAYFFRPFLNNSAVEESIKKLEDKIEILEYMSSDDFNFDEILKVVRSCKSREEIAENLNRELKISIKTGNYIKDLGVMELTGFERKDNNIHKLKAIRLFLKHIRNYQKELKEIE